MSIDILHSYLSQAENLVLQHPPALDQLAELITHHLDQAPPGSSLREFFEGERAFYHQHYHRALKHYAQAYEIPNYLFYCHRTIAFIYRHMAKEPEALKFAKRALANSPHDALLQQLVSELSFTPLPSSAKIPLDALAELQALAEEPPFRG